VGEALDSAASGERVEAELDRIVEKRHDQRVRDEGERTREALWAASVRRYHARQQQDHRAAWYDYEMRLYRIHSGLASEHLARAEWLENGHTDKEVSA
jgi:vacuolar-type H+-ATPase subunit E/Vma4